MKRLVLLAGLHKTGSTSIQRTCVANQQLLRSNGISYFPEMLIDGKLTTQGNGNHTRLLRVLFRRSTIYQFQRGGQKAYEDRSAKVRAGVKELLQRADGDAVVMAAEVVSTFTPAELGDMKSFFHECGFDVSLICCVRKPLEWLTSMVAQRAIGERGPRLTIEAAIQEFVSAGGIIAPRVQALAGTFPDTDFYSFDAAIHHGFGPVGCFLAKIGIEADEALVIVKANEGKSAHAVRLHSWINQAVGPRGASKQHDAFYTALPDRCPALWAIPGAKFSLLEGEVAPLLSILINENNWLRNRFGQGFYDGTLVLGKGPVLLDAEQKRMLAEMAATIGMPIAPIVGRYIAQQSSD